MEKKGFCLCVTALSEIRAFSLWIEKCGEESEFPMLITPNYKCSDVGYAVGKGLPDLILTFIKMEINAQKESEKGL
jgi:hypothetical protein